MNGRSDGRGPNTAFSRVPPVWPDPCSESVPASVYELLRFPYSNLLPRSYLVIPSLPADTWHHVSIVVAELRMAVHLRPTDPLPAPAPLIPDLAGVCISLNTNRWVDDWWRPPEQSKLCLLGDGSSGVLSLLVESLPLPRSTTGRDPQFADLAHRLSSNRTSYTLSCSRWLSVSTFARSCYTFPGLI